MRYSFNMGRKSDFVNSVIYASLRRRKLRKAAEGHAEGLVRELVGAEAVNAHFHEPGDGEEVSFEADRTLVRGHEAEGERGGAVGGLRHEAHGPRDPARLIARP